MTPSAMTIVEARQAILDGRMSSRELVQSCLDTIGAKDGTVRAWARVAAQAALDHADRIDKCPAEEKRQMPLIGIPFGVKDIFYTADMETSAGSRILKGWTPPFDAVAVKRLKDAGGIVIGKTETTEFASGDPAPTRNPVDPGHTPGGSSAGSGAAVASDMCLGALGSQTAGSILRPAAYCGAVGFKPTYSAVSLKGVLPLAWSMDHAGPIAKTVADAALIFEQIVDPGFRLRPVPDRKPRIGIADRFFNDAAPEVQAAVEKAIDAIGDMGWDVVPVTLPEFFEEGVASASIVLPVEVAAAHEDWFATSRDEYGPMLRAIVETGKRILAPSYVRAQRIRRVAVEAMAPLFEQVDFLLSPSTPAPAPRGLESTGDPRYLMPFSFFGMPTLAIPIPAEGTHLPVSLQLAGAHGNDRALLDAGRRFERYYPGSAWARRLQAVPDKTAISA